VRGESAARVGNALAQDYAASGSRGNPKSLASFLPEAPHLRAQFLAVNGASRQARHVQAAENTLREEIQKAAAAA
jgi:hypothetical protein